MRIPKQIEEDKVDGLKQILPAFCLGMALCEEIAGFGGRFLKGGLTETALVENYLCRTYPPEAVKWDREKVERQLYTKTDGISDGGWDVEVEDMLIDIKWDSTLRNNEVCLALFTGYGTPQLLMKDAATNSVQVYVKHNKLSNVQKHLGGKEYTLKLMWLDLEKLRADLIEKNGKYSIGEYSEKTVGQRRDRVIYLPVKFLDGKYGRLDTIRA